MSQNKDTQPGGSSKYRDLGTVCKREREWKRGERERERVRYVRLSPSTFTDLQTAETV
eukprot:COSAG01_NODE_73125_length_251_cov_0.664474_1_plen_57_part_01